MYRGGSRGGDWGDRPPKSIKKNLLLYFTSWYAVLLDKFHLIIIAPVQRGTAL